MVLAGWHANHRQPSYLPVEKVIHALPVMK